MWAGAAVASCPGIATSSKGIIGGLLCGWRLVAEKRKSG